MTSKRPRDMSASVRARLMNVAKQNGKDFDLILVRFAIKWLLYRLSYSKYRDRFVVKDYDNRDQHSINACPVCHTHHRLVATIARWWNI